jgi:hypothetical protein
MDARQCSSGNCVDGVCCDLPCAGQCEACNLPQRVGSCAAVVGPPQAPRFACSGASVCAGRCDGTNRLACAFPGAEQTCAPATCEISGARLASTCNGAGTCVMGQLVRCASCDAGVCVSQGVTQCDALSCPQASQARELTVSCDCSSSGVTPLWLVGLAMLLRRR